MNYLVQSGVEASEISIAFFPFFFFKDHLRTWLGFCKSKVSTRRPAGVFFHADVPAAIRFLVGD